MKQINLKHSPLMTAGPKGILLFSTVIITIFVLVTAAAAQTVNDESIARAVLQTFINDDAVAGHLIDVDVEQGVVTLSGLVDNLLSKERAAELTSTIKGVRSVVNLIEVKLIVKRSDDDIKKAIRAALAADPATRAYEVEIKVHDGRVTLDGTVESYQEGELAAYIAKGVRGVIELTNNLSFDVVQNRPDSEIKTEIEESLKWNVWVDSSLIEVTVNNGNVILSGTVSSVMEADKAVELAWVAGVRNVDSNALQIDWQKGESTRRRKPLSLVSDDEIHQAVLASFLYDPRLLAYKPKVSVEYGVVYLTGRVSSLSAKQAAEQDALNTVGVLRVKNYLQVRPEEPVVDKILEDLIHQALVDNRFVTADQITVTVMNGKAFLAGEVESYFERRQAEKTTAEVAGVIEVENNIVVMPRPLDKSDFELLLDIRDELFWSPYVDEDQIKVSVNNGIAYLSGTVDSVMERNAAEDNAYQAGARTVVNHLKVKNLNPFSSF